GRSTSSIPPDTCTVSTWTIWTTTATSTSPSPSSMSRRGNGWGCSSTGTAPEPNGTMPTFPVKAPTISPSAIWARTGIWISWAPIGTTTPGPGSGSRKSDGNHRHHHGVESEKGIGIHYAQDAHQLSAFSRSPESGFLPGDCGKTAAADIPFAGDDRPEAVLPDRMQ